MNQKERLDICSACTKRKLDYEHGFVCQLTGSKADFEGTCKDYLRDDTVTDTITVRTKERPMVPLFDYIPPTGETAKRKKAKKASKKKKPGELALKKLRRYQSFLYAFFGGLLIASAAAVAWAVVAYTTGFQEVYMALGVGLLVGLAVRFFGAGRSRIFGVLAALLALAASLLGYYLCQNGFLVEVLSAGMTKGLDFFKPDLMISTMLDVFVPLDLLFYSLAVLLGYLLAIRRVSAKKMKRLEDDDDKGAPFLYWIRLPLILVMILLTAYFAYTNIKPGSGDEPVTSTRYYDSGEKMSEGQIQKESENGKWTQWHKNGNIKSVGYFTRGLQDSLWHWYNESGVLTGMGMYLHGKENGTWVHYFPNGLVSDSGTYLNGTMEGRWQSFYETGSLKTTVQYKAGAMHGERILFSPAGKVAREQYFENGVEIE